MMDTEDIDNIDIIAVNLSTFNPPLGTISNDQHINYHRTLFANDLEKNLKYNVRLTPEKKKNLVKQIDSTIINLHSLYSYVEEIYQELKFKDLTDQI